MGTWAHICYTNSSNISWIMPYIKNTIITSFQKSHWSQYASYNKPKLSGSFYLSFNCSIDYLVFVWKRWHFIYHLFLSSILSSNYSIDYLWGDSNDLTLSFKTNNQTNSQVAPQSRTISFLWIYCDNLTHSV